MSAYSFAHTAQDAVLPRKLQGVFAFLRRQLRRDFAGSLGSPSPAQPNHDVRPPLRPRSASSSARSCASSGQGARLLGGVWSDLTTSEFISSRMSAYSFAHTALSARQDAGLSQEKDEIIGRHRSLA